ncbi:MAG: hypothetical protein AB1486_33670 [Planctomycetota bacterium]
MDINVVDDALSWVVSHPERFFTSGKPTELELLRSVWMDAVLCGATEVATVRKHGHWIVGASADWLGQTDIAPSELFTRLVPLPQAGPNSVRSEILLRAFCSEVGAVSKGRFLTIKGGKEVEGLLTQFFSEHQTLRGAVAFQL